MEEVGWNTQANVILSFSQMKPKTKLCTSAFPNGRYDGLLFFFLFFFFLFGPEALGTGKKDVVGTRESGNRIPRLQRPFARSATAFISARVPARSPRGRCCQTRQVSDPEGPVKVSRQRGQQ
ncbi:hypothetical protein LX36DRAFT_72065 [Colletotrichum falcatum]|nr:hypothetical protein LX36DRAFT_72065 [Colletotrichum falcatum]